MNWWGGGYIQIILYSTFSGNTNPFVPNSFLLLDNENFYLLDGTQFLLLGD